MMRLKLNWFLVGTVLAAGCASPSASTTATVEPAADEFSFSVTSDIRQYTGPRHPGPQYFEGACAALQAVGPGALMISPGDIDPIPPIRATLDRFFGTNYLWYPVIGNHEAETTEDLAWLRAWGQAAIPGLVRRGPDSCKATAYSFDYGIAHFAMLNEYCDGHSENAVKGDVIQVVHDWLAADLATNTKPIVFVAGHEPIVAMPDMDNGRLRHKGDSLDAHPANAKRFLDLMRKHHVVAYLTSHTHNTSVTNLGGVWQIDSGHARGMGDKGTRSTFLKVTVKRSGCLLDIYRDDGKGGPYTLTRSVKLN